MLKNCDVVMKGGITSGIVYPTVVCQLATVYQFKSLGGTSAGALAATLTAAAEYARQTAQGFGGRAFDELFKIPNWLASDSPFGGGSNLLRLFQPQPGTRGLFRFGLGFLIKSWPKRLITWFSALWLEILVGWAPVAGLASISERPSLLVLLSTAAAIGTAVLATTLVPIAVRRVRAPWPGPIIALTPTGVAVFFACRTGTVHFAVAVALGILAIFAGLVISVTTGLLIRVRRLSAHHFGLCTGFATPDPKRPVSLVHWLNERLNTIAGKSPEAPLTFGDLNCAGLNLKTITTCLTFGRPYSIPFETQETFYYSPAELRLFFPEEVVRWMDQCSTRRLESMSRNDSGHVFPRKRAREQDDQTDEAVDITGLLPLPESKDLPILVAARLSMSFPVLFCAIPLYAVDWTRRRRGTDEPPGQNVPGGSIGPLPEPRKPERIWFSDGGITSNFPIHLFDSALPRWPTFGLDLWDVRPDRPDPRDHDTKVRGRVWMPRTNSAGFAHRWTRLSTDVGLTAVAGFVPAAIDSARNWMDNLQTSAPGYRDRVAHIALNSEEGGLNLNMPPEIQKALVEYGTEAGQRVIDHFIRGIDNGGPVRTTWDNHRWTRYRSTMGLLGHFLSDFSNAIKESERGDRTYIELIRRGVGEEPRSYPLNAQQREAAEALTGHLADMARPLTGSWAMANPSPSRFCESVRISDGLEQPP